MVLGGGSGLSANLAVFAGAGVTGVALSDAGTGRLI